MATTGWMSLLKGSVSLDDTTSMPLLKSLVLRDPILHKTIEELTQRLFAALFYFELVWIPDVVGSRFLVRGQVLCTRKSGDPALPLILQRLDRGRLFVDGKAVPFKVVQTPDENLKVFISYIAGHSFRLDVREAQEGTAFPLSGSPYTLSTLISRGGLAASFGTRTHKRKAEHELPGPQVRRRRHG